ncbi:iron complex transport system permease protein [Halomicrobium zhouii]|uniref:Cobalamin import system permease protein BtuC n=1 Tax=Halomicrobium zhouii TaxID=767519 RepID=A0A1I6L584_9EURY|nr:iron ABC transporter permease [Halomicrobium zhouii]SFR98641.1 iron complex transport system permease protein [Halomicrobium zhouii]
MAGAHSEAPVSDTAEDRGWLTGDLVVFCLACTAVTVFAGLIQVSFGAFTMTIEQAWRAVFNPQVIFNPNAWEAFVFGTELPEMNRRSLIVWNIRLPRVFVAAIVGASLAVSGAIFQAVTRNELASPYVLGVSSGAGLTVLLTLVVFPSVTIAIPLLFGTFTFNTTSLLPLLAALGGTIAFLLVYGIAWKGGTSPVRLVLAGVIVNMVFQSLQRGLFFFADDLGVVQSALAWITGSLTGTGWEQVRLAIVPATIAILLAVAGARQLNVLLLGERTAQSLGMRVERVRFMLSGVAILAASTAIAVAGIIGFFGLVVPHVVRIVLGSDYRRLVIGCVFAGPALLVVADVGARLALSPIQIPVGVVTGVVGGPYFLYLMRKQETMGDL